VIISARFKSTDGRCRVEETTENKGRTLQGLLEEMWEVMAYTAKSKGPRFSSVEALVALLILEIRQLRKKLADSGSGQ
jgi:hypothetical protein